MAEHYFLYPFGVNGDLLAIPNPTQISGAVSYSQGFPIGYEEANTSPGYLPIPRNQFNQLMNDVTTALQQIQQTGFPSFITSAANGGSPFSYALGAEVWFGGTPYRSLITNNTDTPPTSNWAVIGLNRSLYFNYAPDTGTANHYATAPNPAIAGYADGQVIELKPAFGNTGACDINVNGNGIVPIKTLQNQDPPANTIIPAGVYTLVYSSNIGGFVVQNPSLGTASYQNVGVAAGNVVSLNGSAQIPDNLGVVKNIIIKKFTANSLYTPSPGLIDVIAEGVGGGASGGSCACNASDDASGGGGGGGEYSKVRLTAAQIGVSQPITIGPGGVPGAAGAHPGNNGGTTSLGTLLIANGGAAGAGAATGILGQGGAGGTGGTGDLLIQGQDGGDGNGAAVINPGGSSHLGYGGKSPFIPTTGGLNGNNGRNYGGGGSGSLAIVPGVSSNKSGGAGAPGIIIVTEYCSQ